MSRGFYTTYGAGASDVINTKYNKTQSSKISIFAWYYKNASGDNAEGTIIHQLANGVSGFNLSMNVSNSSMRLLQGASGGNNTYTWTVDTNKVWENVCVTYDSSSSANKPTVYINGSAVSVSATGTNTPGYNTNTIQIGNFANIETWDGMLAHIAYWNGVLLSAQDIQALASGTCPVLVRPDDLSLYMPLDGVSKPEIDIVNGCSGTITGTAFGVSEPPAQTIYEIPGFLETTPYLLRIAGSLAAEPINATLAIAGLEKFAGYLAPTAPANTAQIYASEMSEVHPGRISIADAMRGGLLGLSDTATAGLAAADAALYDVQIMETV